VLIENKIYAEDQRCQLVRYRNYDPKAHLIYLTLDGVIASEWSTENEESGDSLEAEKDYFTASYKETVLTWLEECKRQAEMYPPVREALSQYINLIQKLTRKPTRMTQEIEGIILGCVESFTSAKNIANTYNSLVQESNTYWRSKLPQLCKVGIWREFDIFCGVVDDDGAFMFFDAYDQAGKLVDGANPEFSDPGKILLNMGFEPGNWHLGWKSCLYSESKNEDEFFRLYSMSPEEAFEELMSERDRFIDQFKSGLEDLGGR